MSDWGGTNASSLETAINSIFGPSGNVPIGDYLTKLVSCTADGANVNFGHLSGLLTRIGKEREWLLKVHCANHRVELAVKGAFKGSAFEGVDDFYQQNFKLLKSSGKLKSSVLSAASALGIESYVLPRLTGTRFIGHRVTAFKRLLDMWPAFITAYENCLSDSTHSRMHAKVRGQLKLFQSYRMLCLVCTYLDILEKMKPASKVFEGEGLLAYDVKPCVDLTIMELEQCKDSVGTNDEFLDSNLARLEVNDEEPGIQHLFGTFLKAGNATKAPANREFIKYEFKGMRYMESISRSKASSAKVEVIDEIIKLLEDRFRDFQNGIYDVMRVFDPKNWTDAHDYGNEDIKKFAAHFKPTLAIASFNEDKIIPEWKSLRNYVKIGMKNVDSEELWKKILGFKRSEFPNVCALVEILISVSGSNSTVERAFSTLTNILTDKRLSMKHKRMEQILIISSNDKNWTIQERNEIIERAVDIYLQKRRKAIVAEPPSKKSCLQVTKSSENNDEDDFETDSESETENESSSEEEL